MVPRFLEKRSSSGYQSLMSWRHKGKRRLSSLYFLLSIFFFIILCDFYIINMRERGGRGHGICAPRCWGMVIIFGHDLIMSWWEKKKRRRSSLRISLRTLLLHILWDFSMRKSKILYLKILGKILEEKVFSDPSIEMFLGHQSLMSWRRRFVFS